MRIKARNWVALALGTIVALVASYQAYQLGNYSWNQVVAYRGPYATVPIPQAADPRAGQPPYASALQMPRMVFVIVDGLREDVSRTMPTLNSLRNHGYDAVVRTGEPSLSFPNWTTLLSGAPQRISGVTTNWFTERVPVETLIDVALRRGETVAVSTPSDFEMLYGVKRSPNVLLRDGEKGVYMTGGTIDNAIALANDSSATVLIVHCPDIDDAGHASGGASQEYRDTAGKVDRDIGRLVTALQDERTTFVVASDHGHIDAGGHGGWEDVVVNVPVVFAGPEVMLGSGQGTQDQVAPTVALLHDLPALRNATGEPLPVMMLKPEDTRRFADQEIQAFDAYTRAVSGSRPTLSTTVAAARATFAAATDGRAARERDARTASALALAALAIAVLVAIGVMSWRALVSALAGTVFYYLVYNGLFFLAHGYAWSLSALNSEDNLKSFFNGRMVEAVIAGVVAAAVAADMYLALRKQPRRPTGEYLPGWLALGTATTLAIEASLAIQVAWFLWRYGAQTSWVLPDFKWGFKYDLDLIQLTALAGIALLAPLVTWLVGRYHPIRQRGTTPATAAGGDGPGDADPAPIA